MTPYGVLRSITLVSCAVLAVRKVLSIAVLLWRPVYRAMVPPSAAGTWGPPHPRPTPLRRPSPAARIRRCTLAIPHATRHGSWAGP
jgi:hypothetical protein